MNNLKVTAETVETSYIDVNGMKIAFRKFGVESEVPLVFCHRFRGTMDDWDPAVVNGLAEHRTLILFDNVGVGNSEGVAANSIPGMADYAIAFIEALGLKKIDLLGFSMGGFVAQTVTITRPDLVRRLVLAGTGPGAGEGIQGIQAEVFQVALKPVNVDEDFLYLFFEPTETSQIKGKEYLKRLQKRHKDRSPLVKQESFMAQAQALQKTSGEDSLFPRLADIKQTVLVMNGDNDIMAPTINSYIMSQKIENAQLIIYPDSGHGFLFQYPKMFAEHVTTFLNNDLE
ncbi:MAG: alpha/beta fold hydrolase [Bacillota bacterium]